MKAFSLGQRFDLTTIVGNTASKHLFLRHNMYWDSVLSRPLFYRWKDHLQWEKLLWHFLLKEGKITVYLHSIIYFDLKD